MKMHYAIYEDFSKQVCIAEGDAEEEGREIPQALDRAKEIHERFILVVNGGEPQIWARTVEDATTFAVEAAQVALDAVQKVEIAKRAEKCLLLDAPAPAKRTETPKVEAPVPEAAKPFLSQAADIIREMRGLRPDEDGGPGGMAHDA